MSFYLDTSVVVTSLANEEATDRVLAWLGDNAAAGFVVSDWVVTEFSAALSMKLRNRFLDEPQRTAMLGEFKRLLDESYEVLAVAAADFHAASRLADRSKLGLRAGDALHLAISSAAGRTLCTRDKRLAEAGQELALGTILL